MSNTYPESCSMLKMHASLNKKGPEPGPGRRAADGISGVHLDLGGGELGHGAGVQIGFQGGAGLLHVTVHHGGGHVGQDGGAEDIQAHGLQGVHPHGDQDGGAGVGDGAGVTVLEAPQGGGVLLREGAVQLVLAQEAGAQLAGGVLGGQLGIQHSVDVGQGSGHRVIKGVGGAGCGGILGQLQHLAGLVLIGKGVGGGVVQGHRDVADVEHLVFQVVGELVIGEGSLAADAVDQVDQGGLLGQVVLVLADGVLADAVGLVQVAVAVHQLVGVAVGLAGVVIGEAVGQLAEAVLHSHIALEVFLGGLGHKIADGDALAVVGGDGLFQEGLDLGGVLILAGVLGGLLVGVELGQQVEARADLLAADGSHRVGGGDGAASQGEAERQHSGQREQFLFHCGMLL